MINRLLEPLRERPYARKFIIAFVMLATLFVVAAVLTSLISLKPFPGISLNVLGFAAVKAFSMFQVTDYVFLVVFPLLAALLWVHYDHARCVPNGESGKSRFLGSAGVGIGLVTAACPLCFIPLLGLTASAAIVAPVATALKWLGIALLIGALVFVMRKKACCLHPKKGDR